jgi:hypothetical protein
MVEEAESVPMHVSVFKSLLGVEHTSINLIQDIEIDALHRMQRIRSTFASTGVYAQFPRSLDHLIATSSTLNWEREAIIISLT